MSPTERELSDRLAKAILGECPYCRLPIYMNDPRRLTGIPPGTPPLLYHAGCAMAANGLYWEKEAELDCQRLRGCGYVVELHLIRPVR